LRNSNFSALIHRDVNLRVSSAILPSETNTPSRRVTDRPAPPMMTNTHKHKQLQCYALIKLHLYYTAQMTVTDELDNLQSVPFLEH